MRKSLFILPFFIASSVCAETLPDSGKPCSDGSQCQSGYCVGIRAECNGETIHHPKGSGYEQCQVVAGCSSQPITGGCYLIFEDGKHASRCLN